VTRRGRIVPFVLLSLAAILVSAWLFSGSRALPEASAGASGQDVPEARPADAVAATKEMAARERETLPVPANTESDVVAALAPPERAEPVILNGAAIRVEAGGAEDVSADGGFVMVWRRGAEIEPVEVEVLGGLWSVEVPPDAGLYVRGLVLDGIPVTLEDDDFSVPADRFLTLRGLGRHAVLLHVLSGDESELRGVEIWNGPQSFPTDTRHPGADPTGEPVVRGAASPVLVPPRLDSMRADTQYFVRAPGHAWGSIALDHSAAGERTLALRPECALEVELLGSADWLEPEVRLWPPGASKWAAYAYAARKPDAEGRAVFESLVPGTYFASVERGWADRRTSYGSATVEVIAGERITLPLTVRLPPRPETVVVSGTLTLPLAWERTGLKLLFAGEGATEKWLTEDREVPLTEMTLLAETAGSSAPPDAGEVYAFEVELPTAGSYKLEVFPLLVRRLLKVPAAGLDGVDVVVPQPADVEVRVTDDATGEPIEVESIYWSSPPIDGIVATPLFRARADPGHGRLVFRAPAAEIRLSPTHRSLLPVDEGERFLLQPGPNSLEFRVHQQIGVHFTFKDGDSVVPWEWSWRLSAHRIDGEGRDRSRSVAILWFLEPGTYELRTQGIPGFESIDGFRIEVAAGRELIEVEVPLVRE